MNREARKQLSVNQQKLNMPTGSSIITNDAIKSHRFYLLNFFLNVILIFSL
jgi:hypothetical protein